MVIMGRDWNADVYHDATTMRSIIGKYSANVPKNNLPMKNAFVLEYWLFVTNISSTKEKI